MAAQVDNNMTNKEAIERWATYIIPAVFKAEDQLLKEHPKWKDRLRCLANGEEDPYKVSEEYCTAIATIIVTEAEDYNQNEKEE
jgi:hypothetical protein